MKIGVIGLGLRLGYLMEIIARSQPQARFVGYVDPSPYGLPYLQEHGVEAGPRYDSPHALLRSEALDLLMIGSPNHLHLEHIRLGLEAGIKVFSEKPVVSSEADTFALLDLLRQHGNVDQVMIGLVLRYAPLYRDLVASHAAGQLGAIASIEASEHIAPYHGAFFMRDWRRRTGYSGGFILEKCCHDIDLYQGLVGSRARRVASFGGRKTFVPENLPSQAGVNDMDVYYRKPGGWESRTGSLTAMATSSTTRPRWWSSRAGSGYASIPTSMSRTNTGTSPSSAHAAWPRETSCAIISRCTMPARATVWPTGIITWTPDRITTAPTTT